MRTLFAFLLAVLPLTALAQKPILPEAPAAKSDFVRDVLTPATVLLFNQDEDGSLNFECTATAFFHDEERHEYMFATASHCVSDNDPSLYISSDEEGNRKEFIRVEDVLCGKEEKGMDVCLLFVGTQEHFPVVPLSDNDPTTGAAILNVSSPAGLGKMLLHGYVAKAKLDRSLRQKKIDWSDDIVVQMPGILGGSSGSSLVCEDHKICGILVGVYSTEVGHLQLAVPVSRLKKLLKVRSTDDK